MSQIDLQHILAAIDFSPWTSPVLRTATEVAIRYDSSLEVVYAETFLPPPCFTEQAITELECDAPRGVSCAHSGSALSGGVDCSRCCSERADWGWTGC